MNKTTTLLATTLSLLLCSCGGDEEKPKDDPFAGLDVSIGDISAIEADSAASADLKLALVAEPSDGMAPLKVLFTLGIGTEDPNDFAYLWSWGDGQDPLQVVPTGDLKGSPTQEHVFEKPGTYQVSVTVARKSAPEQKSSANTTVTVAGPPSLSIGPVKLVSANTVYLDETIALRLEILNKGSAVDEAFDTVVFLSEDKGLDETDVAVHSVTHPSIGNGSKSPAAIKYTADAPLSFKVSQGFPAGSHYLIVQTDYGDKIAEADEADNVAVMSAPLTVHNTPKGDPPDLSVEPPTFVTGTYAPGDAVNYQLKIKNAGQTAAVGFTFALYLSEDDKLEYDTKRKAGDPGFDGQDILLTDPSKSYIKSLGSGLTLPLFKSFSVPAKLEGERYLIAHVDNANQVTETDESNNIAISATKIAFGQPKGFDLALVSVKSESAFVALGDNASIKWKVHNGSAEDTPSFPATIWMCPTPSLSKATCVLNITSFTIAPVEAGKSFEGSQPVTISTKTPLQPWHVFMRIDPDNKIGETNENNNIKKTTTTLTVQSS